MPWNRLLRSIHWATADCGFVVLAASLSHRAPNPEIAWRGTAGAAGPSNVQAQPASPGDC